MVQQLVRAFLDGVVPGPPRTHRGLVEVPLLERQPSGARRYVTLDEASAEGQLEVTEVSEQGRVPELRVRVRGERDVLLSDGEELVGAKQDRVLNLTVLVPCGEATVVPVSCVEMGRWDWTSRRSASSDRVLHTSARAAKARSVGRSASEGRGHRSDQHAIWDDIARTSRRHGSRSSTGAIGGVFEVHAERLKEAAEAFRPLAGQRGALYWRGGRPVGLELFDHPETAAILLPKVARSHALEEVDAAEPPPVASPPLSPTAFLEALLRCVFRPHPTVGRGTAVPIEGGGLVGGALVFEDAVVQQALDRRRPSVARAEIRCSIGAMTSAPTYRHRQLATSLFILLLVLAGGFVLAAWGTGWRTPVTPFVAVLGLLCVLFFALTVEVDAQEIRLSFGIGIIRRTIPRSRIVRAERVTTPWWYGYGIRRISEGWMWNISGRHGVRLTYTDGTRFRIGTDDPEGLLAALGVRSSG